MLLRVKPVPKEVATTIISSKKYTFKGELFITDIDLFFDIIGCRCGSDAELVKTKLNNRIFYTYVRCKACQNKGELVKVSNVSRSEYNASDWWDIAECEDAVAFWNAQQMKNDKRTYTVKELYELFMDRLTENEQRKNCNY